MEALWKIKMVRRLTDKVSPDVIVQSSFEYELPAFYSDMLDHITDLTEESGAAVYVGIQKHREKKFAKDGFFGEELLYPQGETE